MIAWDQIVAECDGYRAGFVTVFLAHEGEETNERDGANRVVKVTVASFAEHVGIPRSTFTQWLGRWRRATAGQTRSGQMGRQIAKSPVVAIEDKVGMLSDLMSDPKVMRALDAKQRTKLRARPAPAVEQHTRSDDEKAEAAANALAVLILRGQRGDWKPSRTTNALLYFLGQLLAERTIPQSVTDKLVAEIEDELRAKVGD